MICSAGKIGAIASHCLSVSSGSIPCVQTHLAADGNTLVKRWSGFDHLRSPDYEMASNLHPMWGKAFAWAAVASSLACGGSSSSTGACSTVAACGGDIVGTWKFVSACGKLTGTITEPGSCTVDVSEVLSTASGTETFNADGTYMVDESTSESDNFSFGAACLSAGGVTQTCAQLASALMSSAMAAHPSATISPWECSQGPAVGGCSCNASVTVPGLASGTYTTVGSAVTLTPSAAMAETSGYCVKGSELSLIATSQELGMASLMSGFTFSGFAFVLTKE